MSNHDNFPVIVGAAQYVNRSDDLDDAREPLEMMALVARAAEADAGVEGLLAHIDSLQVVGILGWPYPDASGLLAQRLGARPAHTLYSAVGGETPQRLINETAQAIVEGRVQMALLAGAEALHSLRLARARGHRFDWTPRGSPLSVVGDTRPGFSEAEARHGATIPSRVYPLFENAIRADLGLSIEEHQQRLGRLCARFAAVAAGNPYAWFPRARTAEEITAVGPKNRMVCFPYPKLMNAIIETDQAAAVILTSVATARRLGIPEERWVYLWGCGDAVDKWFISERQNYYSSPAIAKAARRALDMAGVGLDEIAMFDLYSCFPSAVQLALAALGLDTDDPRPLTVTGGLPYAGGPGNNYVTHSVAATVERLRAEPERLALVTGLGWFATKHSVGIYGGRPPSGAWTRADPAAGQALIDAVTGPPFTEAADGAAVIETYTVAFDREGQPEQGIIIGRLEEDGRPRFFANAEPDVDLLWAMTREEFVGRKGRASHDAATRKNTFRP